LRIRSDPPCETIEYRNPASGSNSVIASIHADSFSFVLAASSRRLAL
jgi:hypothetical protein